jgi:hypothetical protein
MRLEEPSRRIVVEVVVPPEPVAAEPDVDKQPESEPQPQLQS